MPRDESAAISACIEFQIFLNLALSSGEPALSSALSQEIRLTLLQLVLMSEQPCRSAFGGGTHIAVDRRYSRMHLQRVVIEATQGQAFKRTYARQCNIALAIFKG